MTMMIVVVHLAIMITPVGHTVNQADLVETLGHLAVAEAVVAAEAEVVEAAVRSRSHDWLVVMAYACTYPGYGGGGYSGGGGYGNSLAPISFAFG